MRGRLGRLSLFVYIFSVACTDRIASRSRLPMSAAVAEFLTEIICLHSLALGAGNVNNKMSKFVIRPIMIKLLVFDVKL